MIRRHPLELPLGKGENISKHRTTLSRIWQAVKRHKALGKPVPCERNLYLFKDLLSRRGLISAFGGCRHRLLFF